MYSKDCWSRTNDHRWGGGGGVAVRLALATGVRPSLLPKRRPTPRPPLKGIVMPDMDTCIYCGISHPMMRWTKPDHKEVITVCYQKKCERAANAAGFKRMSGLNVER